MIDTDDIAYITSDKYMQITKDILSSIRDLCNDLEVITMKYSHDRYLTSAEVAERLKCTVQQIPRDIPCNHIGRNYIYSLADLERYLSEKKSFRK